MTRPSASSRNATVTTLTLILYLCSLVANPVPFVLIAQNSRRVPVKAGAMSEGCEKGSCCTAFCYLDNHGVHHCVPARGDSCSCGMSSKDSDPELLFSTLEFATIRRPDCLHPIFQSTSTILQFPSLFQEADLTAPTPPPRILHA